MCFGALFALCIVACCAYKICGPAEEEDWGRRYKFSTIKPIGARIPPELLKEIYTLPTNKLTATKRTSSIEKKEVLKTPPTMQNNLIPFKKHSFSDVSKFERLPNNGHPFQRPLPPIPPTNLPNGRIFIDDVGFQRMDEIDGYDQQDFDDMARGPLLSSLSTSRLLNEPNFQVAPRRYNYNSSNYNNNSNSTFDLSHPQHPMYSQFQSSSRSLTDSRTDIV